VRGTGWFLVPSNVARFTCLIRERRPERHDSPLKPDAIAELRGQRKKPRRLTGLFLRITSAPHNSLGGGGERHATFYRAASSAG
jgi:hypothetical protein